MILCSLATVLIVWIYAFFPPNKFQFPYFQGWQKIIYPKSAPSLPQPVRGKLSINSLYNQAQKSLHHGGEGWIRIKKKLFFTDLGEAGAVLQTLTLDGSIGSLQDMLEQVCSIINFLRLGEFKKKIIGHNILEIIFSNRIRLKEAINIGRGALQDLPV